MTPKQIQEELKNVVDRSMMHREALAALEKRRLELLNQLRSFSSSITSTTVVGQPGIIQGPPPNGNKRD